MYTQAYEVMMLKSTGEHAVDLSSTGDKALWAPVFWPHRVIAAAVTLSATPGDAGVLKGDLRYTVGSDTNRTDGTVFTINLLTTHAVSAGTTSVTVYHVPSSPVIVYPGMEVVAEMTDASASASACKISLVVEPLYQNPSNTASYASQSTMVATT